MRSKRRISASYDLNSERFGIESFTLLSFRELVPRELLVLWYSGCLCCCFLSFPALSYYLPEELLYRASNNVLEHAASIITVWIDIIEDRGPNQTRGLYFEHD